MIKFNLTKSALLITACTLASLSVAQTAPTADANPASNSQTVTSTSVEVKPETGLLTASAQSQHDSNNQLGLFATKSAPIAPGTADTNSDASSSTVDAPATQTTANATQISSTQTVITSTQLTQSVAGKLEQNMNALNGNANSATDKLLATGTNSVKSQTDFAQTATSNINAHTQATLAATNASLGDLQTTTAVVVSDAVKSGVSETLVSTTSAQLNQEVSNQVNSAVTQEIGKTIQSSVTNSITTSVTQNLGL